jgi:hypothetical protein
MAIYNLFSKRQKLIRGEAPDIFVYDTLPKALRVQIVKIITETIGKDKAYTERASKLYNMLHDALCREYGTFRLTERGNTPVEELVFFLLEEQNIEKVIDLIELSMRVIDRAIRDDYSYEMQVERKSSPDEAIEELNERFKEHGIGYQFISGEILRVDSQFTHVEIIKPVLNLLKSKKFSGANEEFLLAHEHYRHGRNKECLNECLKAFESTMKIICDERNWPYNSKDTAARLIQVCFKNDLLPQYFQSQFTSLITLMESGIPTLRNRNSGHGQGSTPKQVDNYLARFALNNTGSNILLLIEQSGIK